MGEMTASTSAHEELPSSQQVEPGLMYGRADPETRKMMELELERDHWQVRQQVFLQWTGLFLGFLTTLAFLGVSAWLIDGGASVAGTILGTIDLVALVTVFVIGRRS